MTQSRSADSEPIDTDIDTDIDTNLEAVLNAARKHRPADLRAGLDDAVAARGLGRCIDEVLLPAVRELGARDAADNDHDPTVRLAVEAIRAWLESVTAHAPTPHDGPPLIVACAPGDRHSLPLEAFIALLRHRRQPCRMLGPRVSARAMSIALEVNRPAAVLIASQRESGHPQVNSLLQAMEQIGITTFYAGAAFDPPPRRRDTPGTYLGTNLENARDLVLQTLRSRSGDVSTGGE